MRTAIVSDLHLGSGFGEDLLRAPGIRRTLLDRLADADRLILLGDVLELRELPLATVLGSARPFFEELGEAMAGRPVILVPGNHDHRLAEPLLEQLALAGEQLGLEHRSHPAGVAAGRLATWLGDAELEIAYPGIRLREDVYATHGHYMDCHMSLPRMECIAAAATMRTLRPLPSRPSPVDYEQVLRPVYELTYGLAQGGKPGRASRPSERAWRSISSRNGSRRRRLRRAAIGASIPAAIWSLNRLLRAEFETDFSAGSISASGIAAATELSRHLRIDAAHVLTGHTHRGGPWDGEAEWPLAGGGRLHNTGSWVFATAFHHPGTPPSAYWPGTVTWLEEAGPPRRERLLLDRPYDELRSAVARLSTAVT
ncbi:MAG TPA: metallophosphoesterase family protein [Solirubrobacterales bacterium]|nr:metallophosphoesterase family protein [Solirubrobacterales bacterium]